MTPSASKKPAPKAKPAAASSKKMPPAPENPLPLKGKKVVGGKPVPPQPVTGEPALAQPAAPAPEATATEQPLCWIELVKSGNIFIARSNTGKGASKEYKNRVLEDMLTELIVELQEEIQE